MQPICLPCPAHPAYYACLSSRLLFSQSIDAQRTVAVAALAKAVPRAILCSGTPALSRPIELYAQVSARASRLWRALQTGLDRGCAWFRAAFSYHCACVCLLDNLTCQVDMLCPLKFGTFHEFGMR